MDSLSLATRRTIISRSESQQQRDQLPAQDGGNLPLSSQVPAHGGQLETGQVGEGAVGECADGQAAHDDQRQTQPRGQARRRRHRQLGGVHCRGRLRLGVGKVAGLDFGAELLVGAEGEERNVG